MVSFFMCIRESPISNFGIDAEYSEIYLKTGDGSFLFIYLNFIVSCYSTLNNL
jgi:hypothetical protein